MELVIFQIFLFRKYRLKKQPINPIKQKNKKDAKVAPKPNRIFWSKDTKDLERLPKINTVSE